MDLRTYNRAISDEETYRMCKAVSLRKLSLSANSEKAARRLASCLKLHLKQKNKQKTRTLTDRAAPTAETKTYFRTYWYIGPFETAAAGTVKACQKMTAPDAGDLIAHITVFYSTCIV